MTRRRFPTERLIWQYTAEVHTTKGTVVIAQTDWSTDLAKPHAEMIQRLVADGWALSGTDSIGAIDSVLIEDYPNYHKGPCVLVLEYDGDGRPIRMLWDIPKNATSPAVLITAYRPDPGKWYDDFQRRKQ